MVFVRPVSAALNPASESGQSCIMAPIVLTADETLALHKKCTSHGCTITAVVSAIIVLAEVESTLRVAARKGNSHFALAKEVFEKANVIPVGMNGVDRVRFLQ